MRLFSAILLFLSIFFPPSTSELWAQETQRAPELPFVLPTGRRALLSQYHGRVVVLEFILTTCVHCQAASKVMTRLQSEYGSRGLQALDLAINGLDEGRTPKDADALVENFAKNFQVGFPVGWVQRDQMLSFMGFSLMQRIMVPQLALIDKRGVIRYQTPAGGEEHAMEENTLRQRIEELLAENERTSGGKHKASIAKSKS